MVLHTDSLTQMFLPHPATPVSGALTPKKRAHQSMSVTVSVEDSKTKQTDEGVRKETREEI